MKATEKSTDWIIKDLVSSVYLFGHYSRSWASWLILKGSLQYKYRSRGRKASEEHVIQEGDERG